MKKWEEVFTGSDRELLIKTGMAKEQKFGDRPALLIIDVTMEFIGSRPQPVLQAAEEYVTSCGEKGWKALPHLKKLIKMCRVVNVPVIYTAQDLSARRFAVGPVKEAIPKRSFDPKRNEIAEDIKPAPSELVIQKTKASGFFGTPLLSCLRTMKTDTLIIAGCTTSGCVRATVVDGFSHGYQCFLVEECVFDRFELSHLVNLFDMNAKYADVVALEKALTYLNQFKKT
ncbi:isochorismatase family protein [Thermodesulfobacteriota bacterium]